MVEFALKVTIVIFITEIIIAPVKIFTEAAASVASTMATALGTEPICRPTYLNIVKNGQWSHDSLFTYVEPSYLWFKYWFTRYAVLIIKVLTLWCINSWLSFSDVQNVYMKVCRLYKLYVRRSSSVLVCWLTDFRVRQQHLLPEEPVHDCSPPDWRPHATRAQWHRRLAIRT